MPGCRHKQSIVRPEEPKEPVSPCYDEIKEDNFDYIDKLLLVGSTVSAVLCAIYIPVPFGIIVAAANVFGYVVYENNERVNRQVGICNCRRRCCLYYNSHKCRAISKFIVLHLSLAHL